MSLAFLSQETYRRHGHHEDPGGETLLTGLSLEANRVVNLNVGFQVEPKSFKGLVTQLKLLARIINARIP